MLKHLKTLSDKRWAGIWVMAVAVIHMAFTPLIYPETMVALLDQGLIGVVTSKEIAAGIWFFLFGLPLYSFGQMIDWLEKGRDMPIPVSAPIGLSLLLVLGVMFFPASGFYLMIPAIAGLWMKQLSGEEGIQAGV